MLTWATFWISDFEEGGAAELGGGALLQSEIDRGTDRKFVARDTGGVGVVVYLRGGGAHQGPAANVFGVAVTGPAELL